MEKIFLITFIVFNYSLINGQNVGIGTNSPVVKLHVVKDIAPFMPGIGSTMAIQSNGETFLEILSGDNSNGGGLVFGNIFRHNSAGMMFNTFASSELSFYTNASKPVLIIDTFGNIGVRTLTPKAALNVTAGKTVLFGGDTIGEGSKMIWYTDKAAFRAGNIPDNKWNTGNVGQFSVAMGYRSIAEGVSSLSIGDSTSAFGQSSVALGWKTNATGGFTTALGASTAAMGYCSMATGNSSFAAGYTSTAMGYYSRAEGSWATAIGSDVTAHSGYETVLGRFNSTYTPISTYEWHGADRLFTIGNGASTVAKSDAMVILKNGNVGIGTASPSAKLSISLNGKELAGTATQSVFRINSGVLGVNQWSETSLAHLGFTSTTNNVGLGIRALRYYAGNYWETTAILLGYDVDNSVRAGAAYITISGNSNVGVGLVEPKSTFEINGGFATKVKTISTTAALVLDNSASVWNFTNIPSSTVLPPANSCPNRRYILVNRSSFFPGIMVNLPGFINLNGVVETYLVANSSIEIISDGSNWLQIR